MVTATPVLVTYEDSLLRPESNREEVIYGELHTMPPATYYHGGILMHLTELFHAVLNRNLKLVRESGFLIAEKPLLRYRVPDLAIADRLAIEELERNREVYARFAPLAVIEVLSPSNRKGDQAQLLTDYRDLGVEQIVFLDPEDRSVRINGDEVGGASFTVAGVVIETEKLW